MSKLSINENIVNLYFPVKVVGRDLEHYYDDNRESIAFETEDDLNAFLVEQPERIKGRMRQFGVSQVMIDTPEDVILEQFEDRVADQVVWMTIVECADLLTRELSRAECVEILDNAIVGLQSIKDAKI